MYMCMCMCIFCDIIFITKSDHVRAVAEGHLGVPAPDTEARMTKKGGLVKEGFAD